MSTTNQKHSELLQDTVMWHQKAVNNVKTIIEHADKPMDFGGGEIYHLTEEEVRPFRLGMRMALALFNTLPFVTYEAEENSAEQFNQRWSVGQLFRIHDPVLMGFKVVKTVAIATPGKDGAIVEINQSPYFVKCGELIPRD